MSSAAATSSPSAPGADDARRIAHGLIGEDPDPFEIERWRRAVALVALPLDRPVDRRLWALARRGGPWMGLVDAGLALLDPWSPVRHRLYLMLAVLEASPSHVARFEARDTPPMAALAALAWHGVRGALRALLGLALVAGIRATTR